MPRKRKPPSPIVQEFALGRTPKGLRAKTRIETRATEQEPRGRVEEDGSYMARDGRVYDPDTRTFRRRVRP